ncbi:MAG: hypothetical protein L0Y75_03540, partial [Acidobacteria bacterium]|nr:hypothetical protein [Acidobacteriota bacterium]
MIDQWDENVIALKCLPLVFPAECGDSLGQFGKRKKGFFSGESYSGISWPFCSSSRTIRLRLRLRLRPLLFILNEAKPPVQAESRDLTRLSRIQKKINRDTHS